MAPRLSTTAVTMLFALLVACKGAKTPDAATANDQGLALTAKGEYVQAIRSFDEAIQKQPDFAQAYKNRGVAYATQGNYDRAIQDYDQAIKLKPDLATAFNSRGVAWQLKGSYAQAVQDFDQAVKLKPDYSMALKNRGRTQFFLGRFDEASNDLAKGGVADSANPYVWIWLHLARKHLGQDDAAQFAASLAHTDSVAWPAPVAKFYLGHLTAAQLLALAPTSDSKVQSDQRCAAAFYVGEQQLFDRRTADATKSFLEARANCPKSWTEWQGAAAELERLGVK